MKLVWFQAWSASKSMYHMFVLAEFNSTDRAMRFSKSFYNFMQVAGYENKPDVYEDRIISNSPVSKIKN